MATIQNQGFAVDAWAEQEGATAQSEFCDVRLARRLRRFSNKSGWPVSRVLPLSVKMRPGPKQPIDFFSNPRVDEWAILSGHIHSTRDRARLVSGLLLILYDTTEISYGSDQDNMGLLDTVARKTICGSLMQTCVVITPEGLPLGK